MFNKFSKLFLLVLIFIASLLFSGSILAQTEGPMNVQYEQINPKDGFSYGVKRLQEKFFLQLYSLFPDKKLNYYYDLTERRLAELKFTIEEKDMANFENATTRYSSSVGEYVNFALKNDKLKKNKKEMENLLLPHLQVLEQLRDVYDPRTAEWRFVEDDINFVKLHINSLKKT